MCLIWGMNVTYRGIYNANLLLNKGAETIDSLMTEFTNLLKYHNV